MGMSCIVDQKARVTLLYSKCGYNKFKLVCSLPVKRLRRATFLITPHEDYLGADRQ
jgi:hypothetical protein